MLYHVDVEKIERYLQYIEAQLPILNLLSDSKEANLNEPVIRLAAERLLHLLAEAITDVSSLVIDGFMLRDPGSYRDMVEILAQEGAFSAAYGERLGELVAFRSRLVRNYLDVTVQELEQALRLAVQIAPSFPSYIRSFLAEELF